MSHFHISLCKSCDKNTIKHKNIQQNPYVCLTFFIYLSPKELQNKEGDAKPFSKLNKATVNEHSPWLRFIGQFVEVSSFSGDAFRGRSLRHELISNYYKNICVTFIRIVLLCHALYVIRVSNKRDYIYFATARTISTNRSVSFSSSSIGIRSFVV